MTVPVVSILTADLGPQLEQENASLHCRIDELVAEVEHWKARLYAARDELGLVRGELAQERAKNRRRGW